MRAIFLFIALAVCSCDRETKSASQSNPEEEAGIIHVDADDEEMNAAMQKARDDFPKFWEEVSLDRRRTIPAIEASMIKALFTEEGDEEDGEHMWVVDADYDGQMITGTLVSQPGYLTNVSMGDEVTFPLSRVSDWFYVIDGKATGAYTVKLLRSRMNESERAEHDSHYPFEFE